MSHRIETSQSRRFSALLQLVPGCRRARERLNLSSEHICFNERARLQTIDRVGRWRSYVLGLNTTGTLTLEGKRAERFTRIVAARKSLSLA